MQRYTPRVPMSFQRCMVGLFCSACMMGPVFAAENESVPRWIWVKSAGKRSPMASFRKSFDVRKKVVQAELAGVADFCSADIRLNGNLVAAVEDFSSRFQRDVTASLKSGRNVIAIQAVNRDGPPAIALRLQLTFQDGTSQSVISSKSWQAAADVAEREKPIAPKNWAAAEEFGTLAPEPWGDHPDTVTISALDDYTQWKQAQGAQRGADPSSFFVRPGFEIELLRTAGPKEGSWVNLEFDPQGRLVIAREDKGLLRLTFSGKDRRRIRVETVNDTLKECRGLLFAHGALYANANESQGLYRLRDTNGDGRFNEVKLLRRTPGGRGHGRNDLTLGPDGKIYAIHGDAVELPPDIPNRRSPFRRNSRKGRRGFILRTDRDGKNWEVFATGMRNPYGIAFNPDGELFTYDADAEYDTGASWYRPTRILHVTPGADFGWRAVTRSWPPYDPDKPDAAPPALDIGKGSPTGVKFGTHSRFPGKYRRALFALDWAYGRILAVHMTPRGAGYAMRAESFLKGRPFNVTDLAFGPDGAMYVVIGGRKTRSGLYRIRYVGKTNAKSEPKPHPQQIARKKHSTAARALRRRLERFHHVDPKAVATAWPHLNRPDPVLRYAARIAVEHQPLETWRKRALAERKPLAALTALLAFAQGCSVNDLPRIVDRLEQLPLEKLPATQQRKAVRIVDLVTSRAEPKPPLVTRCRRLLDPLYPAATFAVNEPLSQLLARLYARKFVGRTLRLLDRATQQNERFHYLFVLRNVRDGWTAKQRQRYFRRLPRMRRFIGGEGMPTFRKRIEADALSQLTAAQRQRVAPLLAVKASPIEIPPAAMNRKFVRDWKPDDLDELLKATDGQRDFARGKAMFAAAVCSACHRMGRSGAPIGPDLTSVGRRFSRRDILRSILEPSRVVAEQYRREVIVTNEGQTIVGTILQGGDYRSPVLEVMTDPLQPQKITKISKQDIEAHRKSKTSIMPAGLLKTLTKDEIADLIAFLEAGGNPKHPNYRAAPQRR